MKTIALGVAIFLGAGSLAEAPPPPAASAPKPDIRSRIRALDRRVQDLFGAVTLEDRAEGRFGSSRYAVLGLRIRPELRDERELVRQVEEDGWSLAQYIVKPRGRLIGPISAGGGLPGVGADPGMIEALARRSMFERAPLEQVSRGVSFEASPILASSATCLECHAGTRLGDPLGAVVYAYARRR